ncbi:putative protein DUF975 [Clostridium aceticum]|uniref:Uncharacterized protein n=1 Tax=Clostridium aceticum TaxID=84022 RepID=A0A0D8IA07_9CLOT|nr:DUF975 family protein [Clostridium aceticum]AKL95940.1 putative protein DUF975 [Clostridium aceticum]KJF27108.1 hypothetical protein TZ02_09950 [Clostridium aceticum]
MEGNNIFIEENFLLRQAARRQLKGNWGSVVLLCLIYSALSGLPMAIDNLGSIVSFLISGALTLGLVSCFIKLVRNGTFQFENLFDGFKNFFSALILQFLIGLFTFLWSLLLIVPGIIACYRYAMAFYILSDHPQMSAKAALDASKRMMIGYKWKLFCLHFSFIGWAFLAILTFGIGFLWLIPYMKASQANFYESLRRVSKI